MPEAVQQMWAENKAHHYWLHLKFMMTKLLTLTWPITLTSSHTTFLLAIHSPSRRWCFKPTHSPPLPYCLTQPLAHFLFCWDPADNRKRTPAALHHYTSMRPCPLHVHPYRVRAQWAALRPACYLGTESVYFVLLRLLTPVIVLFLLPSLALLASLFCSFFHLKKIQSSSFVSFPHRKSTWRKFLLFSFFPSTTPLTVW